MSDRAPRTFGCDALVRLRHLRTAAERRLPDPEESKEFFSTPHPSLVPALARPRGGPGTRAAGKAGRLATVLTAVVAPGIWPDAARCRVRAGVSALAILGVFPVCCETFAFVRGEPHVPCFTLMILHDGGPGVR